MVSSMTGCHCNCLNAKTISSFELNYIMEPVIEYSSKIRRIDSNGQKIHGFQQAVATPSVESRNTVPGQSDAILVGTMVSSIFWYNLQQ